MTTTTIIFGLIVFCIFLTFAVIRQGGIKIPLSARFALQNTETGNQELASDIQEMCFLIKWTAQLHNGYITLCTGDQLKKYTGYYENRKTTVFVALGIGGVANNPAELYIIPLNEIKSSDLHADFLRHYRQQDPAKAFFFNAALPVLH